MLFTKQREPLRIGEIKPSGWLKKQMLIQLNGLSGNLDQFWKDVSESAWIGGDSEGWERFPYWLDGVIPLAWQLEDFELQKRILNYMDYIFENQQPSGWLGPLPDQDEQAKDIWSQFLAIKVLVLFHNTTEDKRVFNVIYKALRNIEQHIEMNPVSHWAHSRWYEALIGIWWLYDHCQENWLLELAVKLKAQGFNWCEFLTSAWPYQRPSRQGEWNYMNHVVNNTQCLKLGPLWYRLSGSLEDLYAWKRMQGALDKSHGLPNGTISGDECLAGKSPIVGTELCSIVEHMYSLEIISEYCEEPELGDRLEKLAFNALPATFTSDMWAHQYLQQINQIECGVKENHLYTTNSSESNVYGLEPHFGCCTSNMHQGFPKFLASLWMREGNALSAIAYAPSELVTELGGKQIRITTVTNYPFDSEIKFIIKTNEPTDVTLKLRVPSWCHTAELKSKDLVLKGRNHIQYSKLVSGCEELTLSLPMNAEIHNTDGYGSFIERGPLLYSYNIPARFHQINTDIPGREQPHCDYEVLPIAKWNFALIDKTELKFIKCPFNDDEIFTKNNKSNVIVVDVVEASNWLCFENNATQIPIQVLSDGRASQIELVPYGCTDLRIAEFPTFKADRQQH